MHKYPTGLVKTIQECEMICEEMTGYLKTRQNIELRMQQLELLRDCADICSSTAKCIARNSDYAGCFADLCAKICKACSKECLKYSDKMSKKCGYICKNCAQECQKYAEKYY
jgi:hypothetical protein